LLEVLERQVHQLVAAQAEADDQAMSVFGGASSSFSVRSQVGQRGVLAQPSSNPSVTQRPSWFVFD
jgi:hypothetical protein